VNKLLPNNSLRNPVVEQVVRETLNLVKDVWKQYGQPDEIHIELARDLKNNSETRKKISELIKQNENERKRIVEILKHLKNANPYSEKDIERLRLWEETATIEAKLNMPKISKIPSKSEIEKYLLWGEQNHISPYTGRVIPLSKLFTNEYEVEHIIPKSRFFDDSFANKTICESSVNKYKNERTAFEFISEFGGTIVPNTKIKILTMDEFKQHINLNFKGKKKNYFLRQSIPDNFINRQINETRYINRKLNELLFPVAKEGIVFTTGQITAHLKDKWGLNRVWKDVLLPRFKRLEKILNEQIIIKDIPKNDIHFNIDCDKKRIDHRHHALDALVIAATTREHIRYLNSLNAADKEEIKKIKFSLVKGKVREFHLPWSTFTKEAKDKIKAVIVSYKNRLRVIQKGYNKYQKWVYENGKWVKKFVLQNRSKLFSVRKSLFKEPLGEVHLISYKDVKIEEAIKIQFEYLTNYQGTLQARIADKKLRNIVNQLIKNCSFDLKTTLDYLNSNPLKDENGNKLKKITILKFESYAAKRIELDYSLDETRINRIPYSYHNPLVKVLKEHLAEFNGNSKEAFTGEGLEKLYKKIGKPIRKITRTEAVGNKIYHKGKLFEIDKGGNIFFIIYENIHNPEDRIITENSSISILDAVQAFIDGKKKEDLGEFKAGYKKIILSPNDLVYVPDDGEIIESINWDDTAALSNKIYKVVSFTGRSIFFVPHFVAKPIIDTKELGSNNKAERDWQGKMIKERCIKLIVDRLGNIRPE
ncbi:MAG: type II CRISPR RNA-guided endonuclease Cas9, partial [Ignavibacteria bacterium]